jgi:hypothetical protein
MPADLTPLPLDAPQPQGRPRVVCALCEEPLTASESRRWQLGPRCRRKLGLVGGSGVGRFVVEQEGLFG